MIKFIKKLFNKEAKSIREIEEMFEKQYDLGLKPIPDSLQQSVNHVYQIISKAMAEEPNLKIPDKVWAYFKANATQEYQLDFTVPIKNQISEDTENILVYFYKAYIK